MTNVKHEYELEQFKELSYYPKNLFLNIFENVAEGIMITDKHKKIEVVNPAFEFATGYKRDEVIGKSPGMLQSGVHDVSFYNGMWDSLRKNDKWQGEIWNRRKTGDLYPELLTIMAIRDEKGCITNYCGVFTDLSERKSVENELVKRTLTDTLTDVSNRFSYLERMNNLLESSSTVSYAIAHAVYFLNLNRFKQINDSLGHSVGDLILVEISKRIQSLLKNKDIVARYGGDEFAITLTNIKGVREAAKIAEQIIETIEKPIKVNGQEIFITASMGVSMYPMDGTTTEELVNRAERAMAYSKENGRNSYVFYFDDLHTDAKRVLLLDVELRKAIENKDFVLHFQPKVCLKTEKIIGVEALVRWYSPKLGFVSPNEFIPYAEETGLIIPLSEIIFEKACEALIELQKNAVNKMPIAINVSSIHFQQANFLETIQSIFERYNVTARNFEIELTERTVMNSATETVSKLVRLKQLGFKLSLDDFGTGYSSLSYLVRFPLDYLKIDRSFIQHICSLDDKQAIVDAIIQMSHRLKMQVIAEGVEQMQQVELLRKMGCDIIQGYHYSKPLPIDELLEFLQFWEVEHQERV